MKSVWEIPCIFSRNRSCFSKFSLFSIIRKLWKIQLKWHFTCNFPFFQEFENSHDIFPHSHMALFGFFFKYGKFMWNTSYLYRWLVSHIKFPCCHIPTLFSIFSVGEILCEMPVTYIDNWYFTWNSPLHCGRAFISWLSANVWGKNEGNTSY